MIKSVNKLTEKTIGVVSSRGFFWFVIGLFVLQATWLAFSFSYPMIYDENFHVPVTQIFADQWSPFIVNQPPSYDIYGNLSHGMASLYHYLMSFPLRVVLLFTDNLAAQVLVLRGLNIAMAAAGLYLYARLFSTIGIKQSHINVAALLFVMLPIVPFVAAHVSYDNMLFLLTAWFFIVAVKLVNAKRFQWQDYGLLVVVGCIASLVKFTFLPVFAATLVYAAIMVFRRYGKKTWSVFVRSLRTTDKRKNVAIIVSLLVSVGMFSAVYLQNTIRFGSPQPACQKTMSVDRCIKRSVVKRNIEAEATKNLRPELSLPQYFNSWYGSIAGYVIAMSAAPNVGAKAPLPVVYSAVYFGGLLMLGVLAYAWRSLPKSAGWYLLLTMSAVLIIAVFMNNYSIYQRYHMAFAMQPRYLLNIAPIIIVMAVTAVGFIFRRSRYIKVGIMVAALALFTQGGGAVTHILRSDERWYWQNDIVIQANQTVKKVLTPIVKE